MVTAGLFQSTCEKYTEAQMALLRRKPRYCWCFDVCLKRTNPFFSSLFSLGTSGCSLSRGKTTRSLAKKLRRCACTARDSNFPLTQLWRLKRLPLASALPGGLPFGPTPSSHIANADLCISHRRTRSSGPKAGSTHNTAKTLQVTKEGVYRSRSANHCLFQAMKRSSTSRGLTSPHTVRYSPILAAFSRP